MKDWKQQQQQRNRYQSLIVNADRLFQEQDIDTALQVYQQAAQIAPSTEQYPFTQLCRCYRKKAKQALSTGDDAKVIQLLKEMLHLNGDRPNLKAADYKVLADAHLNLNQYEEAKIAVQAALKIDSDINVHHLLNKIKAEELNNQLKKLK